MFNHKITIHIQIIREIGLTQQVFTYNSVINRIKPIMDHIVKVPTPLLGKTRPILLALGCCGVFKSEVHKLCPELLKGGLAAIVVLIVKVTVAPEVGVNINAVVLTDILTELQEGPTGREELFEALNDFEGFKKRHSRKVYKMIYD